MERRPQAPGHRAGQRAALAAGDDDETSAACASLRFWLVVVAAVEIVEIGVRYPDDIGGGDGRRFSEVTQLRDAARPAVWIERDCGLATRTAIKAGRRVAFIDQRRGRCKASISPNGIAPRKFQFRDAVLSSKKVYCAWVRDADEGKLGRVGAACSVQIDAESCGVPLIMRPNRSLDAADEARRRAEPRHADRDK